MASSCSEDKHLSSITLAGSLRSKYTGGGSTLDRELEEGGYHVINIPVVTVVIM